MRWTNGVWRDAFSSLRRDPVAGVCISIVVAYMLIAVGVWTGWVAIEWGKSVGPSYGAPEFTQPLRWLGTDIFGRSVLSKSLHGIAVAMQVGLLASGLAVFIGVLLGAIAGYFGGWIDDLIVWFYTTFASIPSILMLMAISWLMQKGVNAVCVAIGLTSWVGLCRIIRGEFMKHKNREYVLAAQSIGSSHFSRIFKHILPNVSHQIIISFSLLFQSAIKSEVILSYLGLGVQGQPSWGIMIDDARLELARGVWWQLAAATGFMFFLVLALNLFGDALRDALDPKLKQ